MVPAINITEILPPPIRHIIGVIMVYTNRTSKYQIDADGLSCAFVTTFTNPLPNEVTGSAIPTIELAAYLPKTTTKPKNMKGINKRLARVKVCAAGDLQKRSGPSTKKKTNPLKYMNKGM